MAVAAIQPEQVVSRRAKDLAALLSCDICDGILREPITAPECMHCYCKWGSCPGAFVHEQRKPAFRLHFLHHRAGREDAKSMFECGSDGVVVQDVHSGIPERRRAQFLPGVPLGRCHHHLRRRPPARQSEGRPHAAVHPEKGRLSCCAHAARAAFCGDFEGMPGRCSPPATALRGFQATAHAWFPITAHGCRVQVARDLGPEDLSQEARNEQWHALKAQLAQEQGAAADAVQAPRPRTLLPAHGAACVDLFINSLSAASAVFMAASACKGYPRETSDNLRVVTTGSGLHAWLVLMITLTLGRSLKACQRGTPAVRGQATRISTSWRILTSGHLAISPWASWRASSRPAPAAQHL